VAAPLGPVTGPAKRYLTEGRSTPRQRVLGPDHPDTLASMTSLGGLLRDTGYRYRAFMLLTAPGPPRGDRHPMAMRFTDNLSEVRRGMRSTDRSSGRSAADLARVDSAGAGQAAGGRLDVGKGLAGVGGVG
jgi:hypothetical protein